MSNIDYTSSTHLLCLALGLSLIIIIRYFLFSTFFEKIFNREKFNQHFVLLLKRHPKQKLREITNSVITSFIFGFFCVALFYLYENGDTQIYNNINKYGLWYLPVGLVLSMLIHETYYYWLHRFMHKPRIYKLMHKTHHDSIQTSTWTSFSFHPIESFFQVFIFLPIILVIPLHPYIILTQLILMTLSSVINHCNIELYPKGFDKGVIGRWIIGATHHALHHKHYKTNYGLYFTFWDKICSTEDKDFHRIFKEKA